MAGSGGVSGPGARSSALSHRREKAFATSPHTACIPIRLHTARRLFEVRALRAGYSSFPLNAANTAVRGQDGRDGARGWRMWDWDRRRFGRDRTRPVGLAERPKMRVEPPLLLSPLLSSLLLSSPLLSSPPPDPVLRSRCDLPSINITSPRRSGGNLKEPCTSHRETLTSPSS